jgi:Protein of unknown function (DUF4038)/Putative collagen-binding domain of a collagenase
VTFPLRVSPNGRYLVGQDGVPFRLNCEAAWFLSTQARPEDVADYLDDRRARGFTALIVMAIVHQDGYVSASLNMPPGCLANAPNHLVSGEGPFRTPGHFATMNDAYWVHVDHIVRAAAERGMVVLLAYVYLGYQGGDQGWWAEVNQPWNGEEVLYGYGRALATRYAADPNIIWYTCGDYSPPPGSTGSRRVRASIDGIRSVLPDALFAAELAAPDELTIDNPDYADLDIDSFYGWGPGGDHTVYETANRAWAGVPARPAFVGEPPYEGIPDVGSTGDHVDIRRIGYYAVLGGGTAGQSVGSSGILNVLPAALPGFADFRTAFGSPGTIDTQHQFALYGSLPWWELVPSGTAPGFFGTDLVASGQRPALEHIAAAGTADRGWLLAYVPPGAGPRTFGIDMSALRAPARARWFNPATGGYVDIAAALPNEGVREFGTPGDNGTGTFDWVLVLDVGDTGLRDAGAAAAP